MHDSHGGRFDIVLAEAMDRLSRDQDDVAAVYKRLMFAGVKIVTLSEGEVSELHAQNQARGDGRREWRLQAGSS